MSWWAYVERTAQTERQRDIAERTSIDATNVSRWKSGSTPGAAVVAQFARAYERPVLEAFVAAGFLSAEEARARPMAAPPTLDTFTDDELLSEIERRLATVGQQVDLVYVDQLVELLVAEAGGDPVEAMSRTIDGFMEGDVLGDQLEPVMARLRQMKAEVDKVTRLPVGRAAATAARDIGGPSAGQKRRLEADVAGEPPVDDPDDMEPR